MTFRHALRVSEVVDPRWQQISLDTATIHIRRAKNGTAGIHGLQGDELRLLWALQRLACRLCVSVRAKSASFRGRRPEAHRTA